MPKTKSGDVEIYYEVVGSGEPLLLIMGTGVDHRAWRWQTPVFAQEFQCILMDNRGTGWSDKPEGDYTVRQMADDAVAVLDAMGVEAAHVAGLSLGSAICQEIAIHYPERVRSVSLYATWDRCYPLFRARFAIQAELVRNKQFEALSHLSLMTLYSPYAINAREAELRRFGVEFSGAEDDSVPRTPRHVLLSHYAADIGHDTSERLHQIRAPTLIVVGSDDPLTRPEYAQAVHQKIGGSELVVIDGADHMMTGLAADAFNAVALDFLRRHRTGA